MEPGGLPRRSRQSPGNALDAADEQLETDRQTRLTRAAHEVYNTEYSYVQLLKLILTVCLRS